MNHPATDTSQKFYQKKRLILAVFVLLFLGVIWWLFGRTTDEPTLVENTVTQPKVYTPVQYDVDGWQAIPALSAPFANSQQLIQIVGDIATRHDGLDIDGTAANLYRFHATDEPPLYIIDSDEFFELSWYFASPKDNQNDKQKSLQHAQKAHAITTAILGKQNGSTLIKNTLQQNQDNKFQLPTGVHTARCQDYLCRLIFTKADFR